MVDRVGQGGSLARAAIEAALRAHSEAVAKVSDQAAFKLPGSGVDAAQRIPDRDPSTLGGSLVQSLAEGVRATNASVASVDRLAEDMVTGKIRDFHELPGRLKQAELTFKFSLEVRNKLIDAYREVMRMSV